MAPRGQKAVKPVLSQGEIQNLQEEKRELEQTIKDAEGAGIGTGREVNVGAIQGQIKRYAAVIDQNKEATQVRGGDKDRMAKRAQELEQQFVQGQPTRYEMDHPARCPGAVKKHMTWIKNNENTGAVEEYRRIQRIINPGEERSIEALRRDK